MPVFGSKRTPVTFLKSRLSKKRHRKSAKAQVSLKPILFYQSAKKENKAFFSVRARKASKTLDLFVVIFHYVRLSCKQRIPKGKDGFNPVDKSSRLP